MSDQLKFTYRQTPHEVFIEYQVKAQPHIELIVDQCLRLVKGVSDAAKLRPETVYIDANGQKLEVRTP